MAQDTRTGPGNTGPTAGLNTELKRPIPRALLAAAAVGWLLFLVALFWNMADRRDYADQLITLEEGYRGEMEGLEQRLSGELTTIQAERDDVAARLLTTEEAVGTIETLAVQLTDAETQLADLDAEVQTLVSRRDAALTETQEAESTLAATQEALRLTTENLESSVTERDAALAALATARAEISAGEDQIAAASQELIDVGARIEEARNEEAELRETIASLNDEATRLTTEMAESQAEVQSLRESEAELLSRVDALEATVGELTDRRENLAAAVAALEDRRSNLESDVAEVEDLRRTYQDQVQAITETLASRSDQIVELEQRIADLQARGSELAQPSPNQDGADASGVLGGGSPDASGPFADFAGRYTANAATATFSGDGRFLLQTDQGRMAEGEYTVSDTELRLEERSGNLGDAEFPMSCRISRDETGFDLTDDGGACSMLDGKRFEMRN